MGEEEEEEQEEAVQVQQQAGEEDVTMGTQVRCSDCQAWRPHGDWAANATTRTCTSAGGPNPVTLMHTMVLTLTLTVALTLSVTLTLTLPQPCRL